MTPRARTPDLFLADELEGREAGADDREALLRSLERSEMRFRLAALATNDAVWDLDARSGWLSVHSFFGHPRETVTRLEDWLALIHPDDRERVNATFRELLEGNAEHWEDEYRFQASDGPWLDIVDRGYVLRDAEGHPERLVGAMQDVTARRRQQEFERQLIGIVSHDLKEPLNTITLAAAALARAGDVGEASQKNVTRVQTAADRATRMIRDLLDFTRARLGAGVVLARRTLDLAPVLGALIAECRLAHPGRAITFTATGDAQGDFDADRLAQVLTNLLENALKYGAPDAPVNVELRGESEVTLTVRNVGPPIPPERLAAMFEPLQRGPTGFDPGTRSIGLGLYIVKHLVEAHGGRVDVRSADVTAFTVHLPRSAEPAATSAPPT